MSLRETSSALRTSAPELTVVTTLYRSAGYIKEFHGRITHAVSAITDSYEILYVNDGSPDASLDIAVSLAHSDSHVRVADLSRNFGHHAAILAGLRHSRGRRVFLIDIDLEEQPEWLAQFWDDMNSHDADMVFGIQRERHGSGFKRLSGSLFYSLFNTASDIRIPRNVCTVRLMTRRYVDAVCSLNEAHIFMAGLFAWAGFFQVPRYVTRKPRKSASTYTLGRSIRLFANAITSFSSYTLTLVFFAGLSITVLSVLYALWLLIAKLVRPDVVLSGFTSIMISLWFLGGAILCALGLIGLYVGRIFTETKGRPQYIVSTLYEAGENGSDAND